MAINATGFTADDQSGGNNAQGNPRKRKKASAAFPFSGQNHSFENLRSLSAALQRWHWASPVLHSELPDHVAVDYTHARGGIIVSLQDFDHKIRIEKKSVTADVPENQSLTAEAADFIVKSAMSGGVFGIRNNVRATGSDYDKILLYLAAGEAGKKLKNAKEIEKLATSHPAIWATAEKVWNDRYQTKTPVAVKPADARKKLDLVGGEAARAFGLITPAQQARVEDLQLKAVAIAQKVGADAKKILPDPFKVRGEAYVTAVDQLAHQVGLNQTDLDQAAADIGNPNKKLPEGAPQFSFILTSLGYLQPDVTRNLLEAQSAVRALDIVHICNTNGTFSPLFPKERLFKAVLEIRQNPSAQRGPNDTDDVLAAQGNHLDAWEKYDSGVRNDPQAMETIKSRALATLEKVKSDFTARQGPGWENIALNIEAAIKSYKGEILDNQSYGSPAQQQQRPSQNSPRVSTP
jgi:hypothetical protein